MIRQFRDVNEIINTRADSICLMILVPKLDLFYKRPDCQNCHHETITMLVAILKFQAVQYFTCNTGLYYKNQWSDINIAKSNYKLMNT